MKKDDREREILRLWLQRSSKERTALSVLSFHSFLETEHAHLLVGYGTGKSYQRVQALLSRHIVA